MLRKFMMGRFADLMKMEADGGGAGGAGGAGGGEGSGGGDKGGDKGGSAEAKFTQEDLNRIGATEKAAGKASILKALGFEDETSAQEYLKKVREEEEKNKTQAQKDKEAAEKATSTASAEKARADLLEQKITALSAGANPKTVDDLVVLVRNRVTDAVDFTKALEAVKKETAFATFFTASGSEGGDTGGDGNPPRGKGGAIETKGIGKRLAESKGKSQADAQTGFKGYFSQN